MDFCKTCGTVLPFAGMKCPKCGNGAENAGAAETPSFRPNPSYSLVNDLTRYKELLSENEELETMIKPQSDFPTADQTNYKKRTLMFFFWPYLVGGIASGVVIYIISVVISIMSLRNSIEYYSSAEQFANRYYGDVFGGYVVAIVIALIIIFFGLFLSKRKRNDFNSNADYMNMAAQEKYQKGLKNQRMIDLYQDNLHNMRKYEDIVPADYRTSAKVGAILKIIESGKAENIEDAIKQL